MCDKYEECGNFKAKEKFKWEGEVRWEKVGALIIPVSCDGEPCLQYSPGVKKKLENKRTRITIEEV